MSSLLKKDHEPNKPEGTGVPGGTDPAAESLTLCLHDAAPPEPALFPSAQIDPELYELKKLLFEKEFALLEKLEKRLDDPILHAQETSAIIAEALALRSEKDGMLQNALEPAVVKILKRALRKNPTELATFLFPLMGPTIRRSISEAFRSMLEGLHKTLEYAFSRKGLKWRWEALRTGKSFSEVVLLNTLVYRTEQVFFIHAKTGLVLGHVSSEGVDVQDADMVSAMFTAIQDIVCDAFAKGSDNSLQSLQLGDYTIFVESGQMAYLACVVRGTAPIDFKQKLEDVLGILHIRYIEEFQEFNGDMAPFETSKWILEGLLETHYVDEGTPLPLWVKALPALIILLVLAGSAWLWHDRRETRLAYEQQYRVMESSAFEVGSVPGLILLLAREISPGHWEYQLLKDPLAPDPRALLDKMGLAPSSYTLITTPYISYEAEMIKRRIKERIKLPDTVNMELSQDGPLRLSGTAPLAWIINTRQELLTIPGVESVDMSNLGDPRISELLAMAHEVESTIVEFPLGKDTPVPQDAPKLAAAMDTLARMEHLSRKMNIAVSLTIYGHADTTGTEKRNYEISQERARTLAAMLYARNTSLPIAMYGMGSEHAKHKGTQSDENQANRKVEMKVHLTQLPSSDSILNILRR